MKSKILAFASPKDRWKQTCIENGYLEIAEVSQRHFVDSARVHSNVRFDLAGALADKELFGALFKAITPLLRGKGEVNYVVTEPGNAALANKLALELKKTTRLIGERVNKNDYKAKVKGQGLIVLDRIGLPAKISLQLYELEREYQATKQNVICLINDSGLIEIEGKVISSFLDLEEENYSASTCPWCRGRSRTVSV